MVLYVCMIFCCCFTSLESLKQKKKKVSKKAKLFKIACKIGWSTEKSTCASDQIFVRPCTRSFYILFNTAEERQSFCVQSFVCLCLYVLFLFLVLLIFEKYCHLQKWRYGCACSVARLRSRAFGNYALVKANSHLS